MSEKDAVKVTLHICPGCGAIYTTPKIICLNKGCAMQFDPLEGLRAMRKVEVMIGAYRQMIHEIARELDFPPCGCSGDHCPDCINAI